MVPANLTAAEQIAFWLSVGVIVCLLVLIYELARAVIIAAWLDLRAWWTARRIPKGWQPSDHPRGPRPWLGIRRPR